MDVELITDEIYKIDLPLADRVSSLYLFTGAERSLLLDAGLGGDPERYLGSALQRIGVAPETVAHVVLSHCDIDHFAGIAALPAVLPRARTIAHRLDADAMRDWSTFARLRARSFVADYGVDEDPATLAWMREVAGFGQVDVAIDGDAQIDLGDRRLNLLTLPGHSRGSIGVQDRLTDTIAISDAVLGDAVPLANGQPAFPPTYRFERDYLATIERVRLLRPALVATAHYGLYRGAGIGDFLDLSRGFALDLRDQVRTQLASSDGLALSELLQRINHGFGRWPREGTLAPLAFPVVGHVEALIHDGQARLSDADGQPIIEALS